MKAYQYRLKPNEPQKILILKSIGACRFVYNYCLNLRIEAYQKQAKRLSVYDLKRIITELKKVEGYKWLQEVNSQSLQESVFNLDSAFTKFFREKKGFPNYKSKHRAKKTFGNPQGVKVDFENNTIQIPKLGSVKAVIHRRFVGKIKTCTVQLTPSGEYYISVLVDNPSSEVVKKPIRDDTSIGLDMGLKDFVTMSTGEKVKHPKWIINSEKRIKCLARRHSKTIKQSSNREKARLRLAKKYKRVSNQRKDFVHKLSYKIATNENTDTVIIEDLNIKGMTSNYKLAKSVQDTCWNMFETILKYKLEDRGKNLLHIGRFEPSSKMCSCGKINHSLELSDREWQCVHCGVTHDRDILAAQNIKKFGLQKQNLTSLQELEVELVEV